MMNDKNKQMYGVPDIEAWWSTNIAFMFDVNDKQEQAMMVMSMLSDVQEMIERDMDEEARQTLNRAKWTIREKLFPRTSRAL